jgi:hypothetical protein
MLQIFFLLKSLPAVLAFVADDGRGLFSFIPHTALQKRRTQYSASSSALPFVLLHSHISKHTTTVNTLSAANEHQQAIDSDTKSNEQSPPSSSSWMAEGLLISSFSDGVVPNQRAQKYLLRGIVRSMLKQEQKLAENSLQESVRASPCNGPNMEAIQRLEGIDKALEELSDTDDPVQILERLQPAIPPFRFVYVPTAMHALRPDSNSTPGRQRQRARADGKARRSEIVELLQKLLGDDGCIATVTLDFDDGSIKQPEATSNKNRFGDSVVFPKTGKDVFRDWQPHLIYVQGGNTFWLYHCMEKGRWNDDLKELLCGGGTFYCGSSAGAIVAGASMETACWKGWDDPSIVPGQETYDDWNGVAGLGLVGNTAFFPHHVEEQWASVVEDNTTELKSRTNSAEDIEVCCLRDDQVCYIDGTSKKAVVL